MRSKDAKRGVLGGRRDFHRLTEEEEVLWLLVSRNVKPLRRREAQEVCGAYPFRAWDARMARSIHCTSGEDDDIFSSPTILQEKVRCDCPPLVELDRRLKRRVIRGYRGLDHILDLHGLAYEQARRELLNFLRKVRAREERIVLIVTGKGQGCLSSWESGSSSPWGERPGVLRRATREWLSREPFRELVSHFSPAHGRHGGDGAIYVRLRGVRPSGR